MIDRVVRLTRSANMSRIRAKDTAPERVVRKILSQNGFRYRLHSKAVIGKPDILLSRHRVAIFIHGCFWHRHTCRRGRSTPGSNIKFWKEKFEKNRARDKLVKKELLRAGWRCLTIWECELKQIDKVEKKLLAFLT